MADSKRILLKEEGRNALLKGVDTLANAVKSTLGPAGRNVVMGRKFGNPVITKDGVSVARDIILKDEVENIGAQMVKNVASKTSDMAGDGTTTATVLAQAMFKEGIKIVTAGANPMDLKKGMDIACKKIVEALDKAKKEVNKDSLEEIKHIGTISANGDKEIGELICDSMKKIGENGVIIVEEAKTAETSIEIIEGSEFDRGYISPYFVTDSEKMEVVFDNNPKILFYDGKISLFRDIMNICNSCAKDGVPLLVVAEDVEGDALNNLVYNRLQQKLAFAAVKAPGFGDRRKDMIEDLAILTGGTVITKEKGLSLEKTRMDQLGSVEKIVIRKYSTILVGGHGKENAKEIRIKELKEHLNKSTSDYDKEKLQERIAKISEGVAILKVGASTEIEMKEKKDRIEDALHATRAALDEGIVPGGGEAYLRASVVLDSLEVENGDQKAGVEIVKKALMEPLKQIVLNAGGNGDMVVEKVKAGDKGYNARTSQYEDLIETGVIDPVKVTKIALMNAVSIASILLTTEVVIYDEVEKNSPLTPSFGGYGL